MTCTPRGNCRALLNEINVYIIKLADSNWIHWKWWWNISWSDQYRQVIVLLITCVASLGSINNHGKTILWLICIDGMIGIEENLALDKFIICWIKELIWMVYFPSGEDGNPTKRNLAMHDPLPPYTHKSVPI